MVWSAAAPAELGTALAHVQWSVLLAGFTPGLPDVFGVPVQPLNLSPPGVSFVVDEVDWVALAEMPAEVLLCALLDAEAWSLPLPLSLP